MIIYFLNLFSILVYALFSKLLNKNGNRVFMVFSFIQLFLLLSLRKFNVGIDTLGYINVFQRTKMYPLLDFSYSRLEPGFLIVNKLFSFIDSTQLFIGILAFITLSLIYYTIAKESKMPWMSVYLFISMGFYTNTFNLLRQVIAMAIILNSYKFIKENNIKKFILSIIVASSFHISALAFSIIYVIKNNKINIINIVNYSIAALFVYLFSMQIIQIALNRFSIIQYELISSGGYSLLLVLIIILVTSLINKKGLMEVDKNNRILVNILILGILTQILALRFSLFTRVTSYFAIFLIILIPEILNAIKNTNIRIIGVSLIIILTAVQYYLVLSADLSKIVPYQFFFW